MSNLGIQYRVAEDHVDAYLFGTQTPEDRLRVLAESILSDLVTRSGVDFVHTFGRPQVQEMLTDRLRKHALEQRIGIRVQTVTLETVEPPLRVRAAFLKVIDERSNKQKAITSAKAYADLRRIGSQADSAEINNEAEVYRGQTVQQAKAEAESFEKLVAQFRPDGSPGTALQETARRTALKRLYLETMEDVMQRVKVKVILQSGKPVDLTIFREGRR